MKRSPVEWKKIFANHVSNKQLTSKIYGELIQFNCKKNNLIFKMGRASEQAFLQRNISMIPRIRFPKGMRLSA